MGHYHIAQICLNGDCISDRIDVNKELSQKYCKKCGAKTITACPNCNTPIRGEYDVEGITVIGYEYDVPAFCCECGTPYPWTKSALDSAELLISEDDVLTSDIKNKVIESLPDIIAETPRTQLAASRFKRALISAGKFTVDGMRQFAIEFGCELALKIIGIS